MYKVLIFHVCNFMENVPECNIYITESDHVAEQIYVGTPQFPSLALFYLVPSTLAISVILVHFTDILKYNHFNKETLSIHVLPSSK